MSSATKSDLRHMRQAISLAQASVGLTGENPAVGCVIVVGGRAVAQAATAEGGRPHAEEQALDQAGARAEGATVYVTLEPCGARSSGGVACADRLIAAGVAQVMIACEDASAFASGQGAERLRAAGIGVVLGMLREEAAALYADYRPAAASGGE